MTRLSLPSRIFLSFVVVLVASATVSVISLAQQQRTAQALRLLHEGLLPVALTIGGAATDQEVLGSMLDRVLEERDPTATREWIERARGVRPESVRHALRDVERARSLASEDADGAALLVVKRDLLELLAEFERGDGRYERAFSALLREERDEARAVMNDLRRDEQEVARRLRQDYRAVRARLEATSHQTAEQQRRSVISVAMLAVLALFVGLLVTFGSQRLLRPLPRLMARVSAVARGDFASRIRPMRDDEFGQLTHEFERMVDAVSARDRQLRELQRTQEQIVRGLRAAVVVVDGGGVIKSVNQAADQVLGLAPGVVGKALTETGLLGRLPALTEGIHRVATGGDTATIAASPLGDPTAPSARYVDVRITPFGTEVRHDAGRRPVLVVADDVTEELRTKARLIQTERLAAIGRMAAHVTHEVRNPLSSIGLNVELLADELPDDGEARTLLPAIQREIDRLTAITEEYLRLARLPEPRLEREAMGDLVEDVASFVRPEMERARVELRAEVESDLPTVLADEAQLRQALLNLLRNAREAMPEGGVAELAARRASGGVEVAVSDRGPGISVEQKAHIFDLFYSTKKRGSGLGLPLTQQVVAAHGGRVECVDGEGGGTEFRIWLPEAPPIG